MIRLPVLDLALAWFMGFLAIVAYSYLTDQGAKPVPQRNHLAIIVAMVSTLACLLVGVLFFVHAAALVWRQP